VIVGSESQVTNSKSALKTKMESLYVINHQRKLIFSRHWKKTTELAQVLDILEKPYELTTSKMSTVVYPNLTMIAIVNKDANEYTYTSFLEHFLVVLGSRV
jgi:hypothetical protein